MFLAPIVRKILVDIVTFLEEEIDPNSASSPRATPPVSLSPAQMKKLYDYAYDKAYHYQLSSLKAHRVADAVVDSLTSAKGPLPPIKRPDWRLEIRQRSISSPLYLYLHLYLSSLSNSPSLAASSGNVTMVSCELKTSPTTYHPRSSPNGRYLPETPAAYWYSTGKTAV
ncbi:MAG: hypothetical protein M5U34_21860 [Chloroflexi bacterium]|nr:hypothetical protein [Chloroflexota bacterium]